MGGRDAILALLPLEPPGLTRKEIWERLPGEMRVNEVRFKNVLEAGGGKGWGKEQLNNRAHSYAYFRVEPDSLVA